ncbi:HDIG domain-containing metalloprotein [Candidatus Solincola tengchongensis]|uniref:HDIG domain-containing metalloprotein n=1 Tax=Candidatus Solincola tengchongensis TaxID=2900693 RepID=UPI00257B5D26|nr:HDIG domain-containing metalloprotein [Candidatus Solincola tengchongensis]
MQREEALDLLHANLSSENLRKHCYATEAVMRRLARELGEDEELWGLAGLLHDIDLEICGNDMSTHGEEAARLLAGSGAPPEMVQAVRMHNAEGLGLGERETVLQHALAAAETVTGLIVAAALVLPEKKLAGVKVGSLRKRMKEKAFARGARREVIMECERAGFDLDRFLALALEAMQDISDRLGL